MVRTAHNSPTLRGAHAAPAQAAREHAEQSRVALLFLGVGILLPLSNKGLRRCMIYATSIRSFVYRDSILNMMPRQSPTPHDFQPTQALPGKQSSPHGSKRIEQRSIPVRDLGPFAAWQL